MVSILSSILGLQLITDARNGEEAENVTDRTNPIGNSAYVKVHTLCSKKDY